jgi:hypothetical protein
MNMLKFSPKAAASAKETARKSSEVSKTNTSILKLMHPPNCEVSKTNTSILKLMHMQIANWAELSIDRDIDTDVG